MAKKPINESDLYQVASYLANPESETEIHAEMPSKSRAKFENEYKKATQNYPLPKSSKKGPYYIWTPGTNKYGKELRIYFKRVPPEPPIIQTPLYTDEGKWYARKQCFRINHSALVMQLFECGFVLGENHRNGKRINAFMKRRFPVRRDTNRSR